MHLFIHYVKKYVMRYVKGTLPGTRDKILEKSTPHLQEDYGLIADFKICVLYRTNSEKN